MLKVGAQAELSQGWTAWAHAGGQKARGLRAQTEAQLGAGKAEHTTLVTQNKRPLPGGSGLLCFHPCCLCQPILVP